MAKWLPNWENEEEYDFEQQMKDAFDCSHVDSEIIKKKYAWEFLRRNQEYQDDFSKLDPMFCIERGQDLTDDTTLTPNYIANPEAKEEETFFQYRQRMAKERQVVKYPLHITQYLKKKYSIDCTYLPDPKNSSPFCHHIADVYKDCDSKTIPNISGTFGFIRGAKDTNIDEDYILKIRFDLRHPIHSQLKDAAVQLEKWQKVFLEGNKPYQPRINTKEKIRKGGIKRHDDLLIRILRIYDARAVKAPWEAIGGTIFPEWELSPVQTAKENYQRAIQYIEEDYPAIALMNDQPIGLKKTKE